MLHGHTRYNLRSRFLEELPDAAVRWLSPRTSQRSSGSWLQPQWARQNGSVDRQHQGHPGQESAYLGQPPLKLLQKDTAARQLSVEHLDSMTPLRVGSHVRHGRFGEGVVIELEGRGQDARAQIRFGAQGVKWLALSVARLEVL
jgi:DNA helicase-2/ATP-dependent DNA helicase PcrA